MGRAHGEALDCDQLVSHGQHLQNLICNAIPPLFVLGIRAVNLRMVSQMSYVKFMLLVDNRTRQIPIVADCSKW